MWGQYVPLGVLQRNDRRGALVPRYSALGFMFGSA